MGDGFFHYIENHIIILFIIFFNSKPQTTNHMGGEFCLFIWWKVTYFGSYHVVSMIYQSARSNEKMFFFNLRKWGNHAWIGSIWMWPIYLHFFHKLQCINDYPYWILAFMELSKQPVTCMASPCNFATFVPNISVPLSIDGYVHQNLDSLWFHSNTMMREMIEIFYEWFYCIV